MESGSSENQGSNLLCLVGTVSCSVCLDAVTDKGDRSIAKLRCGHHFHLGFRASSNVDVHLFMGLYALLMYALRSRYLDCIGSAFNAKGAMQCPNCRHVENGQWLFANGCHPFEDFIVEDWTIDEDLYDANPTEIPYGFRWSPYQGLFSQLSVSLEEVEPPSGAYPELMGNAYYGENSNSSAGARLCPYLAFHAVPRAREFSVPINNPSAHPADTGVAHHNGTSRLGDPFGSHAVPAVTHHHNWHTAATFSNNNSAPNPGDPAAPVSPREGLRLTRRESERLQRAGSLVHFDYSDHGPYPHTLHGNAPAETATDLRNSLNHIHGHEGRRLYHPQPAASPFYNGLIAHRRRPRPRGISLVSSRRLVQNSPAQHGRVVGPSVYGSLRRRSHQDGDNMGWNRDHRFHGWEREGLPPTPWVPADRDSQWRASFRSGQHPENVSAEPADYLPQSHIGLERGAQGRPGMSMDNPYQHRSASNFPTFP